jgi:hypothetical protein
MKLACLLLLAVFQASAFELRSFSEPVPESNPETRIRVTDGDTVFSFVIPKGWAMTPDQSARRVTLRLQSQAAIIMQISTNVMPLKLLQLRQQVTNRFENAVVIDQFEAPSGGRPGLGVEVRHTINGNHAVLTRVCVYKAAGGLVEVSFIRMPEDDGRNHPYWTQFINSFRVEPHRQVAELKQ